MQIATVLNTHTSGDITRDTLDSIRHYVSNDVLLLVDGSSWPQFADFNYPVETLCGFRHGIGKSPYRNVALGLKMVAERWPEADWYCYTEYDVLFTSTRFKTNLQMADQKGIWMLGNDGHIAEKEMPMIESLIGTKFKSYYYLLGCCLFFGKTFIHKLVEIDFFDRFLSLTNNFTEGYMPGYSGYDLSEHMYPSLCRHLGGNIGVFASYDEMGCWHGAYDRFPMRWRPELDAQTENFPDASIMHPLKDYDHPIRTEHRLKRTNGLQHVSD